MLVLNSEGRLELSRTPRATRGSPPPSGSHASSSRATHWGSRPTFRQRPPTGRVVARARRLRQRYSKYTGDAADGPERGRAAARRRGPPGRSPSRSIRSVGGDTADRLAPHQSAISRAARVRHERSHVAQLRRIGRAGLPFAESACGRCGMSQQAVERTLGKLLTDESFRERFFTTPRVTAWAAGLRLSDIELAALSGLSRSALCSVSASLDPRICRLCPESESSPEERRP